MSWEPLKLSAHDNSLYGKLYMSSHDIGIARECADYLAKKGWFGLTLRRRGSTQIQQISFTTTLIVSYSRPFKPGRGSIAFPTRLLKYDTEQKAFHDKLLNLRDKVHAHTDENSYEIRPYDNAFIKSIDRIPYTHFTVEEIDLFLNMTAGVVRRIADRMEEIHSSARTGPR